MGVRLTCWLGTPSHHRSDGRQEPLTQIDSEEWESLDSVDMHTVPNAKPGPFSPRTGDSLDAASAATDVRNRAAVMSHTMSSESSLSRQSTPEKCAVSFWVPMAGGTGKGKPAVGPPAHRTVPNRLLGYQRGAKSAPRAKQDYTVGGHAHPHPHPHAHPHPHPPGRNSAGTKVHKTVSIPCMTQHSAARVGGPLLLCLRYDESYGGYRGSHGRCLLRSLRSFLLCRSVLVAGSSG